MATCSENWIKRVTLFTKRSIIQVALIDFEKSLKLNVPDENIAASTERNKMPQSLIHNTYRMS